MVWRRPLPAVEPTSPTTRSCAGTRRRAASAPSVRRPTIRTGNTRDRQGRLVTCEHDTRRVTRTEYDGTITVIADRFDGKRLNSPNDVVVKSDDFDPGPPTRPSASSATTTGRTATPELPTNVYRVDGRSGQITVATGAINRPNGLCFSPDESKLYIIESGVVPRVVHVFDVTDGGTKLSSTAAVHGQRPVRHAGRPALRRRRQPVDGLGMGEGHDGVMVFTPDAKPIGKINLPERCANLCFGGVKRNRLFMTGSKLLYSLYVNTQGVKGG